MTYDADANDALAVEPHKTVGVLWGERDFCYLTDANFIANNQRRDVFFAGHRGVSTDQQLLISSAETARRDI